jgi:uncharacterized phage protein (TIGR01671 family)
MREILFRGKRIDNGDWIIGQLLRYEDGRARIIESHTDIFCYEKDESIIQTVAYTADPETVGQFTGLTDKNGKKIFEGDILPIEDEIVADVIFKDGCFRMEEYGLCGAWTESGFDECGGGWGIIECDPIDWYTVRDMEVIGNIHDNSELLGVELNGK